MERKGKMRPWAIGSLLVAAALSACVAFSSLANSAAVANEATAPEDTAAAAATFYDNSAGSLFPDTYINSGLLNLGNRGCNSCHDDLADVMGDASNPYLHALSEPGYGRKLAVWDCLSCHDEARGYYSPYLGDSIHNAHYSNEVFVNSLGGNCWSCHSVTANEDGSWNICLFEDIMYEPTLGGYTDAIANPLSREWSQMHGHGDYLTGVATQAAPEITVTMNQDITSLDDKFVVYNTPQNLLDMDMVADPNATLKVYGVVNEREFTVDELRELPTTSRVLGHICTTNGRGSSLVGNYEYTGVLVKDIVEACGGLADSASNMGTFMCRDNWDFSHNPITLDNFMNAIVAYECNGEPISFDQGQPLVLAIPGFSAGAWGKWLDSITLYNDTNRDFDILDKATQAEKYRPLMWFINSGFFQNDGVEVTLGEPVELTGWVWGWSQIRSKATSVKFSTDGGVTWVEKQIPEDFDGDALTMFDFSWTPTEAGTYVIKMSAMNEEGLEQYAPACIIVKVNE